MSYVVSVERAQGVIITDGRDRVTKIASVAEFDAYFDAEAARLGVSVDALPVYNSSTMHFPEDSTSDPAVLALVEALDQPREV